MRDTWSSEARRFLDATMPRIFAHLGDRLGQDV